MNTISGKNVLVTGASGSIGSRLVERLLKHDPATVRALDNNEEGLFKLQKQFGGNESTRFLLGDIRDRNRLELAMEGIDVVFHAAALKHVELNEYNPFETVQTNIHGTQNLIQVALDEEVESFVAISTDKASSPTSVMGATKLLSERLVVAANAYKGNRETQLCCVRFGNVLGSSGSVIPIFMRQIQNGGPVTVTDPEMTRFIMPIEEAAELVLKAHNQMTSGEVFVLKMPSLRIGTLAKAMVDHYSRDVDMDPVDVDIDIIGARPGERVHEKLIAADESKQARELKDMYVILPQIDVAGYKPTSYSDATPVSGEYTSADGELLSKPEIVELIDRVYIDP